MSPLRRTVLLSLLYVCEGLPYGFQATALPVYLRSEGLSLTAIGLLGGLALPWLIKPLWAPWVDAHGSRRAWILPCLGLLTLTAAAAAWVPPDRGLRLLLALVFLMNLFAATLDIAVDGWAIDILPKGSLGTGNIAQVVGYKVGMLGGGGLLVWASRDIGWFGLFSGMAAFLGASLVVSFVLLTPPSQSTQRSHRLGAVLKYLSSAVRNRSALGVIILAGTYKAGETLTDVMWKPYLIDVGYTPAELGWLLGTVALGFSLAGSFAGGLWVTRVGIRSALLHTAGLRILPLGILAAFAFAHAEGAHVSRSNLEFITWAEYFFGGAITTAMFAFMMNHVDRKVGASHFSLLAGIEVLGKVPTGLASGALAETWGYPPVFMLAVLLSLAFLVAVPWLAPPKTLVS